MLNYSSFINILSSPSKDSLISRKEVDKHTANSSTSSDSEKLAIDHEPSFEEIKAAWAKAPLAVKTAFSS